jgi:hypothetical protein
MRQVIGSSTEGFTMQITTDWLMGPSKVEDLVLDDGTRLKEQLLVVERYHS